MSDSEYIKYVSFAKGLIKSLKSNISEFDLVHDLIADNTLPSNNYKAIIRRRFYDNRQLNNMWIGFSDVHRVVTTSQLVPCKYCQQSLPVDCFRVITNKNGIKRIFTTACKKCETENGRSRAKSFNKKQVDTLDDYYITRLLVRHGKYKLSEVTKELIESKRMDIIKMRKAEHWKTRAWRRKK